VKGEDFLRFLQEHGTACLEAAQHLSDNCHSAYDLIRSLGLSHSTGEKLARFLLELSQDGESTKEGIRAKMGLPPEEIAQIIGTSRETGHQASRGLESIIEFWTPAELDRRFAFLSNVCYFLSYTRT
jgi:hypothetical protein